MLLFLKSYTTVQKRVLEFIGTNNVGLLQVFGSGSHFFIKRVPPQKSYYLSSQTVFSGGPGGGDSQVKAAAASQVVKPVAAIQERGLDGGRLAGGKLRKRDFTEEREDFKGFNIKKKTSTDNKYDPMGIFKAKLAGDDEIGRVEGCEEKGEGDGEVKDGMVIFGEEEGREEDQELFNVEKMKVSV